jgi:formylglycine-generating enzyme required for sulfatase activity
LLLFTLKTPSATLDASAVEMTVYVDTSAVTTTDVRHGATKILPGSGDLKTVLSAGSRGIAARDKKQLLMSAIPDSAKYAKAAANKRQPSIGILSVKSAKKVDENLEHISNTVAQELEKSSNAKILFLDDIRNLLHTEGSERLLSCHTDSCISQIGSEVGVDIVIVGNLGQLGSTYILDLRMIDVLRDHLMSRTSISVTEDLGKILGEIPGAISKLVVTDTLLSSVIESPAAFDTSATKSRYQELVVWIFPGNFIMGSQFNCGELDELPTHQVKLNGFYIDRFEVTREEFEKTMGYNPVPARGCGSCPVTNVTWQEASDYCAKLGKRLPTEAEWEYACRSGTAAPFYTGVTLSDGQANFDAQKPFGGSPIGRFNGKVVPIGSYPPNAWNLHDMYGNAAEWCSDWYDVAYYGNSPEDNPQGPAKGTLKVVRGGSWNGAGSDVRSANRMAFNPGLRLNTIGFRCVKPDDTSGQRR